MITISINEGGEQRPSCTRHDEQAEQGPKQLDRSEELDAFGDFERGETLPEQRCGVASAVLVNTGRKGRRAKTNRFWFAGGVTARFAPETAPVNSAAGAKAARSANGFEIVVKAAAPVALSVAAAAEAVLEAASVEEEAASVLEAAGASVLEIGRAHV